MSTKKPMIGIVPLVDEERESYWMLPGYMEGITMAGGIPVMLPLVSDMQDIRQMADGFDGFLFTGGQDVAPECYGQKRLPQFGQTCPGRDQMEALLLEEVLKRDKPLLGICRGIQFLNAMLGGTLYQDLPSEHPSELNHHQTPPYDRPVHEVVMEKDSPLYKLLGKERLSVNSYHHQAVKTLSSKLSAMAYATDGLVEAVWMPEKQFVWAVQWHPEFSFRVEEDSRKILEELVHEAGKFWTF